MDKANLAAAWLSTLATSIGLGSLATQSVAIRDQLDPFHETRRGGYMGVWAEIQPTSTWYTFTKPTPIGPEIVANLGGCLGHTTVHLSREPLYGIGVPKWTALLAVFHPKPVVVKGWRPSETAPGKGGPFVITIDEKANPSSSPSASSQSSQESSTEWVHQLDTKPLIYYKAVPCTTIKYPTLITFLLLSQARQTYCYSGPAGLRMAYASYNGEYQIEWPLGGRPTVSFVPHEIHARGQDKYPETFPRRPQKCIEMGLGIIDITDDHADDRTDGRTRVAFAGRKSPGRWVLERIPNRFSAQRTASDLYGKMGGQAHEVDFLFRRRLDDNTPDPPDTLALTVPSLEDGTDATLYLAGDEVRLIAKCLDCLPWSPLAWSIHRGMKDVLVAYGRQTMKVYRRALAETLRRAVADNQQTLVAQRWSRKFVEEFMANQAASAILGGEECSGDACRIVSAATMLACGGAKEGVVPDRTVFWRNNIGVTVRDDGVEGGELAPDTVVALVKLFFVQWSHEFDYGMYFDIPWELTLS